MDMLCIGGGTESLRREDSQVRTKCWKMDMESERLSSMALHEYRWIRYWRVTLNFFILILTINGVESSNAA